MELTRNAQKVLRARYLLRDEHGAAIETPEELMRRVAHSVARAETNYGGDAALWEDRYYGLLAGLRFLPNSPALMNAGKPMGQLAACFVLPVDDSMDSIFGTLKNAAKILQSGGGTGFSFSHLRPKSDIVRSTMGIASGPVSFMRIYNTATDVIKQGGARRGANMGILRVDHPDVLHFIRAKRAAGELTNFNISIAVTDAFMDALGRGGKYWLVNPRTGGPVKEADAGEVFDEIVSCAWETGDPGLIFIDVINRDNPTPKLGRIESTNPCGEQPLLPNEACVLGSVNLSEYAIAGGGEARLDRDALGADVRMAVRFLDDVIDVNQYPVPEIEAMHRGNRKIGLGVMGFADLLILLGVRYDSPQGFTFAGELMRFIQEESHAASAALAAERGAFPNFKGSVWDKPGAPPMRNATVTTIAPTGSISIIADCSSGIEPIFKIAFKRLVLDTELFDVNKHFIRMARERGFYSDELMQEVIRKGSLKGVKGVPPDIKELFRTAHEIAPRDHIEMQAAFQKYTDNAVSKTINLPGRATKEDVAKAYLLAYDKGCKGITVFRYGTKKRGTLVRLTEMTNLADLVD
ncbi:MAG: adenosylcobalamin-dependent ribonucleoside-diphosphate reductase [Nitrospiraceae bacterium]|nr:adenosylcobalamin-dependent ribonucleoside-diphosphate reductase [Nitrospiraceae bacterium]